MRRLYNAVALSAIAVVLAQGVQAQEIGMVTLKPNASTGEMRADLPARPDGETVYIMRDGERIATATVKSSGLPGGAVLTMPSSEAEKVRVGDRISLTANLTKEQQLPESAYQPTDPTKSASGAGGSGRVPPPLSSVVKKTEETRTETRTSTEKPQVLMGTPKPTVVESSARFESESTVRPKGEQLEKIGPPMASAGGMGPGMAPVAPVSPRLTPRGSDIPLYPAPAVVPEAGVIAPYGVGLAAAAPVGTPFLRSPAFAGPPVIYMPQTVNRVLLPSVTPYPANVMVPPVRYPYASAPFTRTDIYVNLPYGTYYWPNGYAGTTPVEPQIPVYVTAPSTAILTSEAAYTTQRYAPGAAQAETLNPITVPPVAAAGGAVEAQVIPVARTGELATALPSGPAAPPTAGTGAVTGPAGADTPGAAVTGMAPAPAVLPPLQPLSPFPTTEASGAPEPAAISPGGTLPALPPAPDAAVPALPPTNTTLPAPIAPIVPPAPVAQPSAAGANPFAPDTANVPSPNADKPGIVVDDATPNGLVLEPVTAWQPSKNPADSFQGSSVYALVDNTVKTATFVADVPEAGEYELYLFWAGSKADFRSSQVPVTVHTASGPVKATIDQTKNTRTFNLVGTYAFSAGPKQQIVTISSEGIPATGPSVGVSADAMKLVKVR